MIQDIAPHEYDVTYQPGIPSDTDMMLIYHDGCILADFQDNHLRYPTIADILPVFPDAVRKAKFLFRIDQVDYYELRKPYLPPFDCWHYENVSVLRNVAPNWMGFAGITGYQIHSWYTNHSYCGRCGTKMRPQGKERAMECPACSLLSYPTISPSVIVAITDQDRLLLTKYSASHSKHRNYALVAGYNEVGETLEQTVKREVMEEVGLRVKNIRYYKSQPWAFSSTLLAGFFCEVDGDPSITMDQDELSVAEWFHRDALPPTVSTASLTNEMIECFRSGSLDG